MDNTFRASGAQLNNDLIDSVLSESEPKVEESFEIKSPSDTSVHLPAGYLSPDGEVARTAEVREMNGADEEVLGKAQNSAQIFDTILNRAVVSIGEQKATKGILGELLIGDRDALLLGIFKATFGTEVELPGYCQTCEEFKTVQFDLNRDVETKVLVDPIADRRFTVEGRNHKYTVGFPTGRVQRELAETDGKTAGERNTLLLADTVIEIDGNPVISRQQVQAMGMADRNKIAQEIATRLPGPQFEDVVLSCTDCDGEVVVPFSLGALFRL